MGNVSSPSSLAKTLPSPRTAVRAVAEADLAAVVHTGEGAVWAMAAEISIAI